MTNESGVTGREHQMSPKEQSVWRERSGGLWSIKLEEAGAAVNPRLTWAQYWDLAAATRSFNTGWDWETRGVTAWMTAVNLEGGFKPETERGEDSNEALKIKT